MDDFTSSLIPLQQDDDSQLFPYDLTVPTIHPCLDDTIHHQDLGNQAASSLAPHQQQHYDQVTSIDDDDNNNHHPRGRQRKKPSSAIPADNNDPDDSKQKRAAHRDVERLRRQEMANLYASLRNLLPLEYIKGKRSMSDQVHQAVNYITHKEKNIRELKVKRDKLRNLMGGSSDLNVKSVEETNSSSTTFTVKQCESGGIEILMKNDLAGNCFPLSRVLDMLLDEGLNVVNCVCTKVDENFLYTIQTEVQFLKISSFLLAFCKVLI
ncbi:transcription factor bHLH36-like [Coffea eugenioides]|uniref:transcription factor bHLH36-like n=1 Tax=Coffea eugenioides TaxID=49369 RepID=UPI000F60AA39|nr:transcription factor bHLH36-like [Coffea eugenioides]